jgi:L-malate glycosyltransferase
LEEETSGRSPLKSERKIKVLLVAPSTAIIGGQSRQAARLLKLLQEEPQLELSFLPHNPQLPGILRQLQKIKYLRTVVTTSYYWLLLCLRLPKVDVAHVFSASYYSYLLSVAPAILLCRLFGTKCILNYRSGEAEDHLQRWPLTTIPIMRLADALVTPSGYLVDVFARFGLTAQSIFNNVELESFSFRPRLNLQPRFLTSRALEPMYNVACVLKAFSIIQQKHASASLTIVGDGSLRRELENLSSELGLRDTKFLGFVPFEEMPGVYGESDLYLNSPEIDNAPNSLIECMASGLAIVTTNAGGIPYLVTHEETCLMIARGDFEAMAEAACRLLENPDAALEIARKARDMADRFSWKSIRNEWVDLYLGLGN